MNAHLGKNRTRQAKRQGLQMNMTKFWEVTNMVHYLDNGDCFIAVYICLTYQTLHFKYVHFNVFYTSIKMFKTI